MLFVYGTLRDGEPSHARLCGATCVAKVQTEPCYDLFDLGDFPALLADGADAITGELYEVDNRLLAQLDAFEDVPTLYQRRPIRVAGFDAEAYVMARDLAQRGTRIASGDWRRRDA